MYVPDGLKLNEDVDEGVYVGDDVELPDGEPDGE